MYLLTKWEGWMGKYLAQGHGVRIKCSEKGHMPFLAPLAQMHTALIQDFHQWFCKESTCRAVWII